VLVENFRPGVLSKLGYDYSALHKSHPHLIVASISGFGQTGPYKHRKGVDTIIQAMSGFVTTTGFPEASVKVGTTVSDLTAGVYCATGILAALHRKTVTGKGAHVDISMLDTSFAFHGREFAHYYTSQREPVRHGNTSPIGYPMDIFRCGDGKDVSICAITDSTFSTLCSILGAVELLSESRFATMSMRGEYAAELKGELQKRIGRWEREHLLAKLYEVKGSESFPVGPVNTMEDLMHDPQIASRDASQDT